MYYYVLRKTKDGYAAGINTFSHHSQESNVFGPRRARASLWPLAATKLQRLLVSYEPEP